MDFNIPKRHFASSKDKVLVVKIPAKMLKALKKHSEALGWSYTALIHIVLDQFFYAIEGRQRLPDHEYRYMEGERETLSLRLDMAVYEAIKGWAKKSSTRPKVSQLIFLALDVFLSQAKISK